MDEIILSCRENVLANILVLKELAFRKIEVPLLFQDVFIKLFHLDLSPVSHILKDRYSRRGTRGRDPQDTLHSLLAMTLLGVTSIDEWVAFLRSFPDLLGEIRFVLAFFLKKFLF